MRRAQATFEFLVILAVSATYLSAAVALTGAGFAGIETAGLAKNRADVAEFLEFSGRLSERTRSRLSENFTVFPTGRLDIFSDGARVIVSTCGKFSGIERRELSLPAAPFGTLKEFCEDFGLAGRFALGTRSGGGKLEIEVSGLN